MRKTFKMPAPQLSYLKEVNVDLDMTGRHYALLATSEGQLPEAVALSIVKDLMEENANLLTMAELRYIFMQIKINSLENKYVVTVECPHDKPDGKKCGCNNDVVIYLSDADLNPTPSDYEPPKIIFRRDDTEKEYTIMPPSAAKEIQLYDYFIISKGADQEMITKDKKLSYEFTVLHSLLHLVDSDGNPFVKETDNFDDFLDTGLCEDGKTPKPTVLNLNTFQTMNHLFDKVYEVGQYGVQNKTYDIKCKECGGRVIFQLPLLHGLLD